MFKRIELTLLTNKEHPSKTVKAWRVKGTRFAVQKDESMPWWKIHHIPTGADIPDIYPETREKATRIVHKLSCRLNWKLGVTELETSAPHCERFKKVLAEWRGHV